MCVRVRVAWMTTSVTLRGLCLQGSRHASRWLTGKVWLEVALISVPGLFFWSSYLETFPSCIRWKVTSDTTHIMIMIRYIHSLH